MYRVNTDTVSQQCLSALKAVISPRCCGSLLILRHTETHHVFLYVVVGGDPLPCKVVQSLVRGGDVGAAGGLGPGEDQGV